MSRASGRAGAKKTAGRTVQHATGLRPPACVHRLGSTGPVPVQAGLSLSSPYYDRRPPCSTGRMRRVFITASLFLGLYCQHALPAERVMIFHADDVSHLHGLAADRQGGFHVYYSQGISGGCRTLVDPTAPWLHAFRDPTAAWRAEGQLITGRYWIDNGLVWADPGSIGPGGSAEEHFIAALAQKSDSTKTAVFFRTTDYMNRTTTSLIPVPLELGDLTARLDAGWIATFWQDKRVLLMLPADPKEGSPPGKNSKADSESKRSGTEIFEVSGLADPNPKLTSLGTDVQNILGIKPETVTCNAERVCIFLYRHTDEKLLRYSTKKFEFVFDGGADTTFYTLTKHEDAFYAIGWGKAADGHPLKDGCMQEFTTLRRVEVDVDGIIRQTPVLDGLKVANPPAVRTDPVEFSAATDCSVHVDATPSGKHPEAYRFDLQLAYPDGIEEASWTMKLRRSNEEEAVAVSVEWREGESVFRTSYYNKGTKSLSSPIALLSGGEKGMVAGNVTILSDGGLVEVFAENGLNVFTERAASGPFPRLCLQKHGGKRVMLTRLTVTTYVGAAPPTASTTTVSPTTAAAMPYQFSICVLALAFQLAASLRLDQ